jgi:hypothetical protein
MTDYAFPKEFLDIDRYDDPTQDTSPNFKEDDFDRDINIDPPVLTEMSFLGEDFLGETYLGGGDSDLDFKFPRL